MLVFGVQCVIVLFGLELGRSSFLLSSSLWGHMIEGKAAVGMSTKGAGVHMQLTEILDLGIFAGHPQCGHACHFWYLQHFSWSLSLVKGREVVTRSQVNNRGGWMMTMLVYTVRASQLNPKSALLIN